MPLAFNLILPSKGVCMHVCMYTHVVNWTGKVNISLSTLFAPKNLVSRDGFGSPVPRQPAHLHTQAESGACLRDSSRVPRRGPFIYLKPPYAIGSVPSLSGHAMAYRWRSLSRVRQHRASKPQGCSERVLSWQVTMDRLLYASLSHTQYWNEEGMSTVPKVSVEKRGAQKMIHCDTWKGSTRYYYCNWS